ncbi:hypothetical protein [Klenkia taihuensis]|uniref:Uncharacterized protein n=1 Tax=Klenkia taihuensis TaxID=1225127 RepID=A0A1I1U777_9ACTN|nr:hypothetical protein [Klenkia taihuensis]GHE06881.1 hypothetical protein GCM10011381_00530 [Klenkia taihuensis]SFD66554.1 hypothetical protein SAMN05661030_3944 [Klenkia taihuensis]
MLDWAAYDPAKVERVAKILVREACGATGIDGSGGDLAQDLRHDGPDGLTIYEVKSFAKRLTSKQKRQIKASLARAVELHEPFSWVLVIPLDPTTAELDWFYKLKSEFSDVVLEWFGLDWLDGKVAGRESLISYVEGANYTLLRRALQAGAEREALATGNDYLARLNSLHDLGDTISPHWRLEVGDSPWGPATTLTAQREDAPTEDPVELTPRFRFPGEDPEAVEAHERLLRWFRLGGDVEIPGRFVEEVRVTAASEATQRLLGEPSRQVSQLRLISIPNNTGLPLRGTLVLERPGVTDTVSVPFAFTQRVGGHSGSTLTGTDDSGLLEGTLELVEEGEGTATGSLTLSLKPLASSYPHDALPGLRLVAFARSGDTLSLRRGPVPFMSCGAAGNAPEGIPELYQLVQALEVLQGHLGTLVPIPAELPTDQEARELLAMAAALSGTPGQLPYDGLSAPLTAGTIRAFLDSVPPGPGVIYAAPDSFTVTLDGHTYKVPGLALWSPSVDLTNRDELEALAAADNVEAVARFTCTEGKKVFMIRAADQLGPEYRPIVGLPSAG